jgi:hypothetical protein
VAIKKEGYWGTAGERKIETSLTIWQFYGDKRW